jgi:GT2 family glycosyltransferase
MRCPTLPELPASPVSDHTGWPWTEEGERLPEAMPDGSAWPCVAIVTPSYNQGRFIEETIRSVLLQGYPNLEYIITDGGSTDDSVEIIRKYEPWLAHWVSEPDLGQTHAINKGWREAPDAEYVTWLNSDDVLLPGSLRRTVSALAADRTRDLAYGDVLMIDASSRPLAKPNRHGWPFSLADVVLRWQNPVPQQGFLMRRSLLEQVGYLDEDFHFAMDLEYWVRLALAGARCEYIPHQLAAFRRHEDCKTQTIQIRCIEDLYAIHEEVFSSDLSSELQGKANASLAELHWKAAYTAYTVMDSRRMRGYALRYISEIGLRSSPRGWGLLFASLMGDRGLMMAQRLMRLL